MIWIDFALLFASALLGGSLAMLVQARKTPSPGGDDV